MSSNETTMVYQRDIDKLRKLLEDYQGYQREVRDFEVESSDDTDISECLEETNDELADIIYELDKGAY